MKGISFIAFVIGVNFVIGGRLRSWFQIFVGRRVKVLTGCKLWNVTRQIIITNDGLFIPKLVRNWMKNCKNLGVCAHPRLNDKKELKEHRGVMNILYRLLFLQSKLHMYQHYKLHIKGCRYNLFVKMCRPSHRPEQLAEFSRSEFDPELFLHSAYVKFFVTFATIASYLTFCDKMWQFLI